MNPTTIRSPWTGTEPLSPLALLSLCWLPPVGYPSPSSRAPSPIPSLQSSGPPPRIASYGSAGATPISEPVTVAREWRMLIGQEIYVSKVDKLLCPSGVGCGALIGQHGSCARAWSQSHGLNRIRGSLKEYWVSNFKRRKRYPGGRKRWWSPQHLVAQQCPVFLHMHRDCDRSSGCGFWGAASCLGLEIHSPTFGWDGLTLFTLTWTEWGS